MRRFFPAQTTPQLRRIQRQTQRWLLTWGWRSLLVVSTFFLVLTSALPGGATSALAQFSTAGGGGSSAYSLGWVELDGYDTFQVSAPGATLGQRRQQIHQNLEEIRDDYLALENPVADVTTTQTENGQTKVYVN
ncbi:hypothetical protein C7271_25805, partial [filamentous cyanobacterium CCP5]